MKSFRSLKEFSEYIELTTPNKRKNSPKPKKNSSKPKQANNKKKSQRKSNGSTPKRKAQLSGLPTGSLAEEERKKKQRLAESERRIQEIKKRRAEEREQEKRLAEELFKTNPVFSDEYVTRVQTCRCIHNDHVVKDVKLAVPIITSFGSIEFRIFHGARCNTCGKIFMLESEYERLRKSGIILCKIVSENYWTEHKETPFELRDESLLHIYGYNVGKTDNISTKQRQAILSFLVDNGILTRHEIAHYLDFFISLREGKMSFEDAIQKWNMDKKYILDYEAGKLETINIGTILVRNKRRSQY